MNGLLSSNYIKVKSSKRLKTDNRNAKIGNPIAGSNDVENQPGSTTSHGPITTATGVNQPNTITSGIWFGETYTSASGGMGIGAVDAPPQVSGPPLTSDRLIYPYSYSQRQRRRNQLTEPRIDSLGEVRITSGQVENNPSGVSTSGEVRNELDRTTSKDDNRKYRTRDRRRRNLTKTYTRGK